jgi:dimethylsulfoniopropionate demethylase
MAGKKQVGVVTSAAQSPDFGCGVAIGMVRMTHWDEGTELRRGDAGRRFPATVHEEFWDKKQDVAA